MSRIAANTHNNINTVFNSFDRNKDGYLDRSEVRAILINLGETPTKAEILNSIAECDKDGNGKLDLEEFKLWFKKLTSKYHGEHYNRLLLRDKIGTIKRSSYLLPKQTFIYGKPSGNDLEHVAECSWEEFKAKGTRVNKPDYIKMNKNAVAECCTKATEFRAHHLSHQVLIRNPIIVKPEHGPTIPNLGERQSKIKQNFNRPSLPVENVIKTQCHFLRDDDDDYPNVPLFRHAKTVPHARSTNSSRLLSVANAHNGESKQSTFKMKKFLTARSKTVTRWT